MIFTRGDNYYICDFGLHSLAPNSDKMCPFLYEREDESDPFIQCDCLVFTVTRVTPDIVFVNKSPKNFVLTTTIDILLCSTLDKLGVKSVMTMEDDHQIEFLLFGRNRFPLHVSVYAMMSSPKDIDFNTYHKPIAFFNQGNAKNAIMLMAMYRHEDEERDEDKALEKMEYTLSNTNVFFYKPEFDKLFNEYFGF